MRKWVQLCALSGVLAALVGCDAAQKLAEKAEQAVQDVAREAVDGALQGLNEQIDHVQQSANELLGKPTDDESQEQTQQSEVPADQAPGAASVET